MKNIKEQNRIRMYIMSQRYNVTKKECHERFGYSKKVKAIIDQAFVDKEIRREWKEFSNIERWHVKDIEDAYTKNLNHLALALPSSCYSMGEYKNLWIWKLKGSADCTKEYAKSCSWKATHGEVRASLPPRFLKAEVIGGLITLKENNQEITRCEWVEWKCTYYKGKLKSCEPVFVKGWLARKYHTTTKANAIKHLAWEKRMEREKQKRIAVSEKQFQKKQRLEEKRNARWEKIKNASSPKELARVTRKKFFTYQDSIEVGNCHPGTRAFLKVVGLTEDSTLTPLKLAQYAFNPHLKSFKSFILKLFCL